jgi:hypothetical protein
VHCAQGVRYFSKRQTKIAVKFCWDKYLFKS